jgi:hypothetical protein
LLAAAFQLLGPGFVRSVHPATPPEVADQGGQVTGGVRIAVLPMMLLALLGIAGLRLLISPREEGNKAAVKRTSALLMLLAAVMVAGLAFFLMIGRPSPPLPIALAHAGFTNGPAGARCAVLSVTNRGRNPFERDRLYWVESRQNPGHPITTPTFFPSKAVLQPGQSEFVQIPVPASPGEWRVTLWCSQYGWRQKLNRWLGSSRGAMLPSRWRSVEISYRSARSEWISE